MKTTTTRIALASLLGGALLFIAGCSDKTAEDAGRKIDQAAADAKQSAKDIGNKIEEKTNQAVETVKEAAADAKQAAKETASEAKAAAKEVASDAKTAAKDTGDVAARLAKDATITASIKVDLAKDPNLSALKINVDTVNGEVTLRGEAGNADAKTRAGNLARNIAGVTRVNNELKVRS